MKQIYTNVTQNDLIRTNDNASIFHRNHYHSPNEDYLRSYEFEYIILFFHKFHESYIILLMKQIMYSK